MSESSSSGSSAAKEPVKWYRSTWYNATILGLCNFAAPGIWGAMNSLGAGGAQAPYLVNAGNALTFCLMIVSCFFSSVLVHYVGIKWTLAAGTLGFAPYAAGLYLNNRYGDEWLVLLGAAFCGLSAGIFWMAEAAIAISYPEPYNRGKVLGYWLTYKLAGQILGGAINLGLNAGNDQAGKVSYTVYLIFIALQCTAPFIAALLNNPEQVQRADRKEVRLAINQSPWRELRDISKLFFTRRFLLLLLFIGQTVYAEAVYFTYLALWFSVRARALGSFVSAIVAVICGNLLGYYLDRHRYSLKTRSRVAFWTITTLQGAWWLWATVLVTKFHRTQPTYDWATPGFGHAFGVFIFLSAGLQLNYLFLYFIISNIAHEDEQQIIRLSALLRGTESAWQALSYGLNSQPKFAQVGGVYFNFALWGLSVFPAWLVIREFGAREALQRIRQESSSDEGTSPTELALTSSQGHQKR